LAISSAHALVKFLRTIATVSLVHQPFEHSPSAHVLTVPIGSSRARVESITLLMIAGALKHEDASGSSAMLRIVDLQLLLSGMSLRFRALFLDQWLALENIAYMVTHETAATPATRTKTEERTKEIMVIGIAKGEEGE
jgi:hypothetical protein